MIERRSGDSVILLCCMPTSVTRGLVPLVDRLGAGLDIHLESVNCVRNAGGDLSLPCGDRVSKLS